MDINWFLKYAGCAPEEVGCMGPRIQWWLFNVPLVSYPYAILFALLFSPLISFVFYNVISLLKTKKFGNWTLKDNVKNILLIFLIIMIVEIISLNWVEMHTWY